MNMEDNVLKFPNAASELGKVLGYALVFSDGSVTASRGAETHEEPDSGSMAAWLSDKMNRRYSDPGREVLISRMMTPDGTVLESLHVHDYVTHTDANGEVYMLDGGCEYTRSSVNDEPATDVSICSDSPFPLIRRRVRRGTFDREGRRIWKPVCELSDSHLRNILKYNEERGIGENRFSRVIEREIAYREENGVSVPDCEY